MRKSLNDHLDKIEKQTVEEMVSAEKKLQVELKKVLVAMETNRTDFENIRQDVTVTFLLSCSVTPSLLSCGICACNSASFTRLVLQCFSVTDTTPNLETSFTSDCQFSN
jgi:nucleoside recognition membrane protein YjiH